MRARIILRAAEAPPTSTIADELGVSIPTVLLWRRRFKEQGLAGLADAPHPGRPRTYGREVRERIHGRDPDRRPRTRPTGAPAASPSGSGVSASTVAPGLARGPPQAPPDRDLQVQPDPELVAKVSDVVGPVPRPARAGDRAVGGREDPDPGARPDPADAAAAPGPGRAPHPRLQAQRHDLACSPRSRSARRSGAAHVREHPALTAAISGSPASGTPERHPSAGSRPRTRSSPRRSARLKPISGTGH